MLKTSHEWLAEFEGIEVMDPDGWDRTRLEESYAEEISFEEFRSRVISSTISVSPSFDLKDFFNGTT